MITALFKHRHSSAAYKSGLWLDEAAVEREDNHVKI